MNGLYDISHSHEAGTFEVRLRADHALFRGHFPDNPILPGVCSLMIVRDCASRMAGRRLAYTCVVQSKFLAAITPQTHFSVRINLSPEGEGYRVEATLFDAQTTMLKLKAQLQRDE